MADHGRRSPNDPSLACALDDPKGWKNCWGRFMCFSPRRREKYQKAETQLSPGPMSVQSPVETGRLGLDLLNQVAMLPPVMCAPPSSPVSFGGIGQNASLHVSPATLFTLFPATSQRPSSQSEPQFDSTSKDAHVGLFMLDNTLVTPLMYSTLTTASATPLSTAPFTPPPELAHLTTPSSPEVPFAHLLGPSLERHATLCEQVYEHLSLQGSLPTTLEPLHKFNPSSSIGQLVTSNFGTSSPEMWSLALAEMEKGNNNGQVFKDQSVSASGNACFEGFDIVPSEVLCDKQAIMEQVSQPETKGNGLLEQDGTHSPTFKHDNSEYKYWHQKENSEECCSRCGELSARCKDLSEALEKTQRKLTLVERAVNSINDREVKFNQLVQWMQLGAKLQKQNNFNFSKELPWQDAVFSDSQESHMARSSITTAHNGDHDT